MMTIPNLGEALAALGRDDDELHDCPDCGRRGPAFSMVAMDDRIVCSNCYLRAQFAARKPEADPAPDLRHERNRLLAASDHLMMPDYPISADRREAIVAWRQMLRDSPAGPWPEMPE